MHRHLGRKVRDQSHAHHLREILLVRQDRPPQARMLLHHSPSHPRSHPHTIESQ